MKKLFFSMLLSAVIGLGVPALDAEAAQMGTESVMMEMDTLFQATADEVFEFPATEFNADKVTIKSAAYNVEGDTLVMIEVEDELETTWEWMRILDEQGNTVFGGMVNQSYKIKYFIDELFVGSKNCTFILYNYDFTTKEYEKVAVKKATITTNEWFGSVDRSYKNTYYMDYSVEIYLPTALNADALEFYVYDEDKVVGYIQIDDEWSKYHQMSFASLMPEVNGGAFSSLKNKVQRNNGYIYFSTNPKAGKKYTYKAVDGNKTYDLGYLNIYEESPEEEELYCSVYCYGDYAASKPYVEIYVDGYELTDVQIQVINPETKEILATSVGGEILKLSKTSGIYLLNTDKTPADLDGCEIVASYQGKEIKRVEYSLREGVKKAYYNHEENMVVAKTYGIPDGAMLEASCGYGDTERTVKGTVTNGEAILQFEKDGTVCALPPDDRWVSFTCTFGGEYYGSDECWINVMGRTEVDKYYIESGKKFPIEIVISEADLRDKSGDFYAKLCLSEEQVGSDITLKSNTEKIGGVDYYALRGEVPATDAGIYTLKLYRGTEWQASYLLYIMDSDIAYAEIDYKSCEDDEQRIKISMPQSLEGYDKTKFAAKVTDIWGNDIGVTAVPVIDTSYYDVTFQFENVPKDMMSVKVSFTYEGKPIVDISKIGEGENLYTYAVIGRKNSYRVNASYTYNEQNYCLYTAFEPSADSIAYVVESGTLDVIKTWDISKDANYLTKNMLDGLSYNNAKTMYDIYFEAKDGSGYDFCGEVYLGYQEQTEEMEPTPNPDLSGLFATSEDGNFVKDGTEVRCYNLDGTPVINEFKCDGTYTYYFQADGTAMRDRLTYHPDGVHVIYFDENGHEVFSNFANVKKTIAGLDVDDYCFFDVYGYLYVDVVTYDQTGTYLYYANPYGVMDRGKWFEFSESVKWADGTPFDKAGGKYGYANEDGTLMINQWTYDWEGRQCYMQGNGVALYP